MRKGFLAKSVIAAFAFALIGASSAVAEGKPGGRIPADKVEKVKAITDAIGIDSEVLKNRRQGVNHLRLSLEAKLIHF